MPIYEYNCRGCGKRFEKLVLTRDETVCCPSCNHQEVEQLMSGFSVGGASGGFSPSGLSGPSCGSGGFS